MHSGEPKTEQQIARHRDDGLIGNGMKATENMLNFFNLLLYLKIDQDVSFTCKTCLMSSHLYFRTRQKVSFIFFSSSILYTYLMGAARDSKNSTVM